jgi:hypothetical protein
VSACPRQLERLKSAVADPAMAAGDLVDLGNLRALGHGRESVQLDWPSANAGSLIIARSASISMGACVTSRGKLTPLAFSGLAATNPQPR